VPQSRRLAEGRVRHQTCGSQSGPRHVARTSRLSVREARLAPRTRMMLVPTPFGRDLFVAGGDDGVTESRFGVRARLGSHAANCDVSHSLLRDVKRQLDAYFAGRLRCFDVPLAVEGTPFALDVWRAVSRLPTGALASYAEIAAAIGRPNARRRRARARFDPARTPNPRASCDRRRRPHQRRGAGLDATTPPRVRGDRDSLAYSVRARVTQTRWIAPSSIS
jgi:O6-methylguanine-DNA--protein-cysteine methyltransferase